jgi:hypothetical protein
MLVLRNRRGRNTIPLNAVRQIDDQQNQNNQN